MVENLDFLVPVECIVVLTGPYREVGGVIVAFFADEIESVVLIAKGAAKDMRSLRAENIQVIHARNIWLVPAC